MTLVLTLVLLTATTLHATTALEASVSFDVLVYGATPGGVASAVAAAREGARVALAEPSLYIGGAMSGGLSLSDYGPHARRVMGEKSISTEFFRRVARHYNVSFFWPGDFQCGMHRVPWVSEAHVAEQVMVDMLREANVSVFRATRIDAVHTGALVPASARATAPRIQTVSTPDGRVFAASAFLDASYEGALLKMAGASYTFGREANTTYNESAAGRLPTLNEEPVWPFGDRSAQLPSGISPWVDDTNTTTIKGVFGGAVAPIGGADGRVGGYDWRVTLTNDKSNLVPIPEPDNYEPADYELQRRFLKHSPGFGQPARFSVPNNKTDWKMFGVFGEFPNAQWEYPNATYERQQEIVAEFKQRALGLLKFFTVDPAVSPTVRAKMATYGLCKDEYNRSEHWMSQLYVRTALRMVGRRVLTQKDVVTHEFPAGELGDSIGVGAYTVDIPGPVQIIVDPVSGEVATEGALKVPKFCAPTEEYPEGIAPFKLPYATMLPKRGEVDNLLVPVAISASHIAFNSIRMEPTWMTLGQSAGVAAAMAVKTGVSVGDLNVPSLQDRLRALGQLLAPLPPLPPPPPPPPELTGDRWYAFRTMWVLQTADMGTQYDATVTAALGTAIVATEDGSLLKRSFNHSTSLPPADVRKYEKGQRVALKGPPTVAKGESDYWLVEVVDSYGRDI